MRFNMTKSDKKHWIVVLIYAALLLISLVVFLKELYWRTGGTDWNGPFQVFGPTLGTFLLVGFTTVQMVGKRISLACGFGSIALLVAVSLIYLIFLAPIIAST